MSPSGQYCVVSGENTTVAYDRSLNSQGRELLRQGGEHSDLGIDASGDDVYVGHQLQEKGGNVFMVNLRTGQKTVLFTSYVGGTVHGVPLLRQGVQQAGLDGDEHLWRGLQRQRPEVVAPQGDGVCS